MIQNHLTVSQQEGFERLRAYLAVRAVAYSPAILAGRSGTGKTYLAKYVTSECGGRYFNIVVDHLDDLVRYHSFTKITPEEVARLVIRLCRTEARAFAVIDGLESVLSAIAFNHQNQPDILCNFFTAMKRTRDLPIPAIVVVQTNELLPAEILQRTSWWDDPHFGLLDLTSRDKGIIAANWKIMPAVAEDAENAYEIVLSGYLSTD